MRPEGHPGGNFQQAVEPVSRERRGQARKSHTAQRSLISLAPNVQFEAHSRVRLMIGSSPLSPLIPSPQPALSSVHRPPAPGCWDPAASPPSPPPSTEPTDDFGFSCLDGRQAGFFEESGSWFHRRRCPHPSFYLRATARCQLRGRLRGGCGFMWEACGGL